MSDIKQWMADYRLGIRETEIGHVISVADGIAWIDGLPDIEMEALLKIEDGSLALAYQLNEDKIGAILLQQTDKLAAGMQVKKIQPRLQIPTDESLLGRVIDPLGNALDTLPAIDYSDYHDMDVSAPGITQRTFVNEPFYTGNKMIDTLLPIGKGQRELLIGDNGLGKSSIAMDTVIHQKHTNVRCVYVLIGQKRSNILDTIQILREFDALSHITLVVAEAADLPGLQWMAPFAGCTIAEAWMRRGYDTLIVYDDLTTHADCYRQLSLLLQRPPGREAYAADVFYLHSRLLERSTHLAQALGGGSMTALPIIETKEGEIAAYIPTNLISITDGQIFFDQKLFASGFLPAIDIKLSVSRVGGNAQIAPIKQEASRMKLAYLQFLELESFTRLGTHLDPVSKSKIERGKLLREIFKQDRLHPVSIECHYGWMLAYNEQLLTGVELEKIADCLAMLDKKIIAEQLTFSLAREEWIKQLAEWINQWKQSDDATSADTGKSHAAS
jgi:F-type H+-transporting ATPase subunit alpha